MIKYKVIWLLGLPSAGKTTVARKLKEELAKKNEYIKLIDGDDFRKMFCSNLKFTEVDRFDNIRIARDYCKRCVNHNIPIIASFITPYKEMREDNRELFEDNYFEVWLNAPLNVCKERDVKGLYKKAEKGEVSNMTGIDDNFDESDNSDLICYTDREDIDNSVNRILKKIYKES